MEAVIKEQAMSLYPESEELRNAYIKGCNDVLRKVYLDVINDIKYTISVDILYGKEGLHNLLDLYQDLLNEQIEKKR